MNTFNSFFIKDQKPFSGGRVAFSNKGPGANGHPHRKTNLKWKMNLNVKSKTMKLLEKRCEKNLQDPRLVSS